MDTNKLQKLRRYLPELLRDLQDAIILSGSKNSYSVRWNQKRIKEVRAEIKALEGR